MNIFDYGDYKKWVIDKVKSYPNKGRGQYSRIAEHLNASPTIVTQVFVGDRQLTPEQALLLSDFFALPKLESRFLILLVNFARAGSHLYQEKLKEEIEEMRTQSREIRNRVQQDVKLNDEAKAILYSNWYYLAIWSLTAIKGFENLEAIAERLDLNKTQTREALDFLIKFSLVKVNDKGELTVGPTLIHLEAKSPQIPRHHQNWRLQAFQRYEKPDPNDAFYTAPITLSKEDAIKLRDQTLKFIASTVDFVKDSPSEELYCFCIDWFKI
ncbi:MAG: TIGR02147 family protein [Bdellovibrionota bacterium]